MPVSSMRLKSPRLRAALIARDSRDRVFLLQHTRPQGAYWVFPGGGVDAGETVEEAVAREIMEELGVGCRIERLVAVGELILPDRHVVDFFLLGTLENPERIHIREGEGISDSGWFSLPDLAGITVLPPEIVPLLGSMAELSEGQIAYLSKYKIAARKLSNPQTE
jgi:8-oxo-dGTP diphosphatase